MGTTFTDLLAQHEVVRGQYLERVNRPRHLILEDCWASSDPFQAGNRQGAGLGSAHNDLLIMGALHAHSARPGSRRHGDLPPFYRTEQEHWMIVDAARVLEAVSPTATNVLDVLTQFAIFTGFTYTIVEKKTANGGEDQVKKEADPEEGKPKSNPLVETVQKALDQWIKQERWYEWETELFRRSRRDGEAFLILEEDDLTDIGIHFRSVEPEQVKEPMQITAVNNRAGIDGRAKSWKYGILTDKDDTAVPEAYWVVSQFAGDKSFGEMFEAKEVFHLKTEWVDRMAKRGISDFFSVANSMPQVLKLLRNLTEGATVQAAIAWIRSHPTGMSPPGNMSDSAQPITNRLGQHTNAVTYDGVQMLDVSNGMEYTAGPLGMQGKNSALLLVLQAGLRNIGSRWQMPEGLISGDASNANLASALVAEGPFVRALEMRQWHYRNAYCRLLERVLDQAAVAGRLGPARENLFDDIEINVEAKPVVARKMSEETQRNRVLSASGIMSDQTWAAREDLDFQDEQSNMEEHPPQAQRFEDQEGETDDMPGEGNPNKVKKEPEGERIS